jgi:polysaccharide biosynthesis protein PslH
MNLLFLTEIEPFPPNGGEKLRSYGILKLVSELGLTVHAITGKLPAASGVQKHLPGITFYLFDFKQIKTDKRAKAYYHLFFLNKELCSLIDEITETNKIDIAFIDYYFYGQYVAYLHRKGIPVIYGTHNAQAMLARQRPANTLRSKLGRYADYQMRRWHESFYFKKADALLVVSENDKIYHSAFIKPEKITVIPNFLIESDYQSVSGDKENYILMTANFLAYQNSVGLEWFIREVWNQELWTRSPLLLVGLGSDKVFAKLAQQHEMMNVKALGEVNDLKPYISKAAVSIVPLLHGSGTRLKCLESMALKTQLVSTSKGAEGIEHDHSIMIADTAADFRNALLSILDKKTDLTEKAYRVFLERYSVTPNKDALAGVIHKIVNS